MARRSRRTRSSSDGAHGPRSSRRRAFEDLLIIGRQTRPSLYDWRVTRPPPVVPRGMSIGARERIGPRGKVLKGLSKAEAQRVRRALRALGAESVAVCLLFSF